jgi:hypothetical protein
MAATRRTREPDADGYEQEGADHRSSVPLDLDGDGEAESVIAQQAVGADNVLGGGEFPDRDTPPQPPAKGYRSPEDDDDTEDDAAVQPDR